MGLTHAIDDSQRPRPVLCLPTSAEPIFEVDFVFFIQPRVKRKGRKEKLEEREKEKLEEREKGEGRRGDERKMTRKERRLNGEDGRWGRQLERRVMGSEKEVDEWMDVKRGDRAYEKFRL